MDFMAVKHGMADALRVVLTDDGERLQTRANLTGAIDHLLAAGADQGVTRAQVGAHDVLMALGGISLIAGTEGRPDLAAKLVDLLLHGILSDRPVTPQHHTPGPAQIATGSCPKKN
ncbi:hypothetical protein OOK58_04300 [Streptomyces sp. NBC_01728]|uniref:SbtR family transcriptional regulator n=1 Tax=unclassified Streptomyces TaxID=2593676 RepID=UPI00225A0FB9|nr:MULTISPECIES: hypothetical protein [unclassified Streptomyces]MCX4461837.1 hypothetical protein [Streptomyces sp. NBC_01719]MCX4490745.1 hypothetical protein [Streptomyces sp. NBC_01728]